MDPTMPQPQTPFSPMSQAGQVQPQPGQPDPNALKNAMMIAALKSHAMQGPGQPGMTPGGPPPGLAAAASAAGAPGGGMGAPPAAMPGGLGSAPMQPQQPSPEELMMMQQQMQQMGGGGPGMPGQAGAPNPVANALMSSIPGGGQ